jgi:N-acetylglucosamine kinase-like BadF-type ATPase
MRLIADIGGTSSRWVDISKGIGSLIKLDGHNPVLSRGPEFISGLDHFPSEAVTDIIVYGAGCGEAERASGIRNPLQRIFGRARIQVNSDLLAVAHGLLGEQQGLVAILGTGMNVGWYDGSMLLQRLPSLGYLIGDEGSGAHIGKTFLNDLYYGRIPPETLNRLFPGGVPELANTIAFVYGSEAGNRALASYTHVLSECVDDIYVSDLLSRCFREFVHLLRGQHPAAERRTIAISGGIASAFTSVLSPLLNEVGVESLIIEPDPIEGLLRYHQRVM